MKKIVLVIFTLFYICYPASADLSNLIELARNQGEIQKDNQRETASYDQAKAAFDRGAMTKGRNKSDIARQYGEPVVILQDKTKGMEKWIYKKSQESFFGGEQLYIFFDGNGDLAEIEFRAKDEIKEAGR